MPARLPRVLVTGASGFVGRALCRHLVGLGNPVRATTSRPEAVATMATSVFGTSGMDQDLFDVTAVPCDAPCDSDWVEACRNIDAVVHLAGRAHVLRDRSDHLDALYRKANVDTTLAVAQSAVKSGVKRFVYVSSVLVNGSSSERPFSERDIPRPEETYAASKLLAEQRLKTLALETGLDVVIVRPPLVYGPGVKGNLLTLMHLVRRGMPLPLGAVHNQRSLIGLGNLVNVLRTCAEHPAAAGRTFLVSDGEDVSTPELIRLMAEGMGRSPRLFGCPSRVLEGVARILGQGDQLKKLRGNLQVDSTLIRETLGWRPAVTLREGVCEMAAWFGGRDVNCL